MKQEVYLVKNGLSGMVETSMAIFMLKQPHHGYTDKVQQDHSGSVGVTLIDNIPKDD